MRLIEIVDAIEDLINVQGVNTGENIYVKGLHGPELINGFDVVKNSNFTGVFLLDRSGKPAVSARVVEELYAKLRRCEMLLSASIDVMNDVNLNDTRLYEKISRYLTRRQGQYY